MMVNGIAKAIGTVKGFSIGKKELFIQDIGRMIWHMEKED